MSFSSCFEIWRPCMKPTHHAWKRISHRGQRISSDKLGSLSRSRRRLKRRHFNQLWWSERMSYMTVKCLRLCKSLHNWLFYWFYCSKVLPSRRNKIILDLLRQNFKTPTERYRLYRYGNWYRTFSSGFIHRWEDFLLKLRWGQDDASPRCAASAIQD